MPARDPDAIVHLPPRMASLPSRCVDIETIPSFQSAFLNDPHDVQVFLPPGYQDDPEARYKVLYANDGQDMEAVHLQQTLEELYTCRQMEEVIVVAIAAGRLRLYEYGTADIPNAGGYGSLAQAYTDFFGRELMPFINARYRTRVGPQNTACMGWSLGGLSAFDIAWRHPEWIGLVGVFSGSFWWGVDGSSTDPRILHRIVRESEKREGLKMWFEAGTLDETNDRDGNGVIDSIQDTLELMDELALKGYRMGMDMIYVQVEGGRHNQQTWGEALPQFLRWAFPRIKGEGD